MVPVAFVWACMFLCILASPAHYNAMDGRSVYLTPERITSHGYHAERHHVTTSDGYILEMHRIPFKRYERAGDPGRPVVFIMHGLLGASSNFIHLGPDYSIAYNLADTGFDVWMGNARGTRNSRFHINLDVNERDHRREFFDFSWEEIGMIDIPTMIDYVLEYTGKEKLHYIGHSQGGTVFLVLNSMRPEYNEKFLSVNLMAGVGYMEYFPHNVLRTMARFTNPIYTLLQQIGLVELLPPISFNRTRNDFYVESSSFQDIDIKDLYDSIGLTVLMEPYILQDISDGLSNFGGAASKQIAHYGQNIRDKTFRRWDFGPEINNEVYGDRVPPPFNLSLITAKVNMHYTLNDNLLDERDVLNMVKVMPNTVAKKVARETFTHFDFISAPDVKELVTEYIIEDIMEVEGILPPEEEEDINDIKDIPLPGSSSTISLYFNIYLMTALIYFLQSIESFGYKAEGHHVVTDDGYILEMHRMPYRRYEESGNPDRPVVMVMHGIMAASNIFLFLGRDHSIAFNLADAGFDVWLGNARATKNSRFHVSLDPDNRDHRKDFFDLTYDDDIGLHDISAMVNYVLKETGKEKIHYVGHSQGATAFLALNARLALRLGIVEILPPINLNRSIANAANDAADFCAGDLDLKDMCDLMGIRFVMKQKGILDEIK